MSPAWLPHSPVFRWSLATAAGLVVLALLGVGVRAWYGAQESRGQAALAAASPVLDHARSAGASREDRERAVKALEAVIAEHPGNAVLQQAAYRLGNLRYEAGHHAQARAAYEVALAKGASGSLRLLLALGIAYTWEAERNHVNAQSAYEAALRGLSPKDFLYEELQLGLARVQESSGQAAAALSTYQRLLKEAPESRRADDLRARMATLQSQAKR